MGEPRLILFKSTQYIQCLPRGVHGCRHTSKSRILKNLCSPGSYRAAALTSLPHGKIMHCKMHAYSDLCHAEAIDVNRFCDVTCSHSMPRPFQPVEFLHMTSQCEEQEAKLIHFCHARSNLCCTKATQIKLIVSQALPHGEPPPPPPAWGFFCSCDWRIVVIPEQDLAVSPYLRWTLAAKSRSACTQTHFKLVGGAFKIK